MAMEQKSAVLAQLNEAVAGVDPRQAERLAEAILAAREVFCLGYGRSGLSARGFAMRLMHLGLRVSIVGDTLAHAIGPGDLLLIVSASGSSQTLQVTAVKAKACGARVALVTGAADAPLAGDADAVVEIKAPSKGDLGEDRASVLPMGSLFEEASYVLFDILVLDLMDRMGMDNASMAARHANLE